MRNPGSKSDGRRRVLGDIQIANFEMEVRAGRIAGTADRANDLPGVDHLATADIDGAQMAVNRAERPVRQDNCVAVAITVPPGENDHAAVGRSDRRANRRGQIDPTVDDENGCTKV